MLSKHQLISPLYSHLPTVHMWTNGAGFQSSQKLHLCKLLKTPLSSTVEKQATKESLPYDLGVYLQQYIPLQNT